MQLNGVSLIGFQQGSPTKGQSSAAQSFYGVDPSNGSQLDPAYFSASEAEVAATAELAAAAFPVYSKASSKAKGEFLRAIAAKLAGSGDEMVRRARLETGLPEARLRGELGRTTNQLLLFAELVEEGSWVNARIDTALPQRQPIPRPDIRSMLRPLGPVAIFGASNFPLAFSVAGGDTASAFAAGNPVIVKAHPAHPGTSELAGVAIRDSVRSCGLPEGVFSLLFDAELTVAKNLVAHPAIKAVAFTGSATAGKALMELANSRPEPIPCYAEMGSTNPVFVLPGALDAKMTEIAAGLYGSFTLGCGQFCTKPGLVFVPAYRGAAFANELVKRVETSEQPHVMLTAEIARRYAAAARERESSGRLEVLARLEGKIDGASCPAVTLYRTDANVLLDHPELGEEIFGPSTVVVHYRNRDELLASARALSGHLTATVLHDGEKELLEYSDLLTILETKVGRLLCNGYPTGVEVCHAMVHSGPFPATSDGRSTSVGTQAIFRFVRPVCYQSFQDALLPEELRNSNPLGITRLVNGKLTGEPLASTK